jgi:hypothetical protein
MNITQDMKDILKEQRLEDYRAQIFNLEMDLVAFEAIEDETMISKTKKSLEAGKKAYAAVEAM